MEAVEIEVQRVKFEGQANVDEQGTVHIEMQFGDKQAAADFVEYIKARRK